MTSTRPAGTRSRSFASAWRSPVSVSSTIFAAIVPPIPGICVARPSSGELGHRRRGLPHPRRGAPVRGEPEGVGAVELEQVGQELEPVGELRVRRQGLRHPGDDTAVRLVVCLPTYEERENLEPMVRALGDIFRAPRLDDARVLVVDDASPDGTGEIADRLASELDLGRASCTASARRVSARLRRRLPPRPRGRRRARHRDGLRLLPRPRRTCHGSSTQPLTQTSCSARATCPAVTSRTGGPCRRAVSAAGSWYARAVLGLGFRDLTGRLQVLPPGGARADRPRLALVARLRVPDRDDVPRRPRRASAIVEIPITFTDREVGGFEDDEADRRRGDLADPEAPSRRAPASVFRRCYAGCDGDAATSLTQASSRTCSRRRVLWSSTSGRRGAAPAVS